MAVIWRPWECPAGPDHATKRRGLKFCVDIFFRLVPARDAGGGARRSHGTMLDPYTSVTATTPNLAGSDPANTGASPPALASTGGMRSMLGRSGEVVLPSPKAEPAVSPGSPLPPGLQTPSRPPNGELACPVPSCNFSPWLCLAEVIPCRPWMALPGSRSRSHPLHFVHALRISQPARRQGSCAHSESCRRAAPAVRVRAAPQRR